VFLHEGRSERRFLEATITEVQSALARRVAMHAGFWVAAAAMTAMAGLLAVDAATAFAAGFRPSVYGLAMAAGAAAVGAAMLAGRTRVLPPMCVAQQIERVRPELKHALMTFVELRGDPSADPSMTAAVGRRAARILAEADISEFVPTACVRRAAWAAMGGACLLGVMLWLTQGVLFRHGPAAAEASLMGGGLSLTGPAAIQHELGAAAPGDPQKPPSAPAANPDAAAAPAPLLAAALQADKEKLDKLAAALGAAQGGAGQGAKSAGGSGNGDGGQGANAGGAGGSADEGDAAGRAPSAGGAGSGANGRAPNAGDSGRAPSVSSGSRTNEGKRSSAGGNSPAGENSANVANAQDLAGGARNASAGDKADGNVGPGGAPGTGEGVPKAPAGRAAPPLTKRPQSDAFPASTLGAMRKVRRLIDEADKRLREGEISDAFLSRMGMSNAEFRRFVAGWQRQLETPARETISAPPPPSPTLGGPAPKLEFSPAGGGSDARPITGLAPQAAAIQGGAVQGADTSVSVRLRPAVSAYFEKVGRLAAEKADQKIEP
jgi:hypothetical protein